MTVTLSIVWYLLILVGKIESEFSFAFCKLYPVCCAALMFSLCCNERSFIVKGMFYCTSWFRTTIGMFNFLRIM